MDNMNLRYRVPMAALRLTEPLKWYINSSPAIDSARKARLVHALELIHDQVLEILGGEEERSRQYLDVEDPKLREGLVQLAELLDEWRPKVCLRPIRPSEKNFSDRLFAEFLMARKPQV